MADVGTVVREPISTGIFVSLAAHLNLLLVITLAAAGD